jgi:hypothetical protein
MPFRNPRRPRHVLSAALLCLFTASGCSPDGGAALAPADQEQPSPSGIGIALHVDLATGRVEVARPPSASAAADGLAFALVGRNELLLTGTNMTRSAVGAFLPNKVRVRFDLALTNRLTGAALVPPSFPSPPSPNTKLLLFPFQTAVVVGTGKVTPSRDWDTAPRSFFNDAACPAPGKSDCYRSEPYASPLHPAATTAPRRVGFDVDPSVQSFTATLVLAADLVNPGRVLGRVSAGDVGLQGVTITATPGPASAITQGGRSTGLYGLDLAPGTYNIAVTGLPAQCATPGAQSATVTSGSVALVNFAVACT